MGKLALYDAVSEDMETNRNLKQPGHCGIAKYQDPSNSITEPLKLAILVLNRVAGREKSAVEWIGILQDYGRRPTLRRWFGRT
jgi:hypothetical protein